MQIKPNTKASFYIKRRKQGQPAHRAIRLAAKDVVWLDKSKKEGDKCWGDLQSMWESLGKTEPKKFSDQGKALESKRRLSASFSRRISAASCYMTKFYGLELSYAGSWQNDKEHYYIANPDSVLRNVQEAGNGYYTHPLHHTSDEVCQGYIGQLPAKNGKVRFVAGYKFNATNDSGVTFDFSEIYESENPGYEYERSDAQRDAERAAESLAEYHGEREREYQTAWQAGRDYADSKSEEVETRREILDMLKERRAIPSDVIAPRICENIRWRVLEMLEQIKDSREKRKELADGSHDWLCFYPGDKRLRDAFNEGAECEVLA